MSQEISNEETDRLEDGSSQESEQGVIQETPTVIAQPVAPAERLTAVDVIRGFALLGILAMNIAAFAWPFSGYQNPYFSGGNDIGSQVSWAICTLFFDGKMMSIFSMLFGGGLVLMANRAKERGAKIAATYYRRIFVLLIIGLVHAYLIWMGDILVSYALAGMLLFLARRFYPSVLIALGICFVIINVALFGGFLAYAGFASDVAQQVEAAKAAGEPVEEWQEGIAKGWKEGMRDFFEPLPEKVQEEVELYQTADYLTIVQHRAPEVFFFQVFGFLFFFLFGGLGRMFLGMGLMKTNLFSGNASLKLLVWMMALGYGFGLSVTAVGAFQLWMADYNQMTAPIGTVLIQLGVIPTALGHIALGLYVYQRGYLPWLTARLAAVGRLALTNYLMQSLLCTFFFYGYALGSFGTMNRLQLWLVVLIIWVFQLFFSPLWLKFFRYGPAEWLWRTLTYGKLQPIWSKS